jgi:DMSO reductase anchor subunit
VSPRREATVVPEVELRTYYGEPVLKEPVWKWEIPAYLFTGGLAAGSSLVAAAADLAGDEVLARRMEQVALGAAGISGVLLTSDLGRPARAHHMLRVVKPSSPMSIGAWLLCAFSAGTAGAVTLGRFGAGRRPTRALRLATAALAPAVASYTAVLLADTAIPAWHDAHRELPFVFVGGAAASAAGLGLVLVPPDRHGGLPALLVAGAGLELIAARIMERHLDRTIVGRAYRSGRAKMLSRIAQVATVAGGAVAIAGRRRRGLSVAGGLVGLVGAIAERYAIVDAGRASARDPFAVVEPQRERTGAAGSAR